MTKLQTIVRRSVLSLALSAVVVATLTLAAGRLLR